MCGRYIRRGDKQRIAEAFHTSKGDLTGPAMPPDDYNVAPTTFQPVIRESREDSARELVLMRCGLIPFFTKQLSDVKGVSTINGRAESHPHQPNVEPEEHQLNAPCFSKRVPKALALQVDVYLGRTIPHKQSSRLPNGS